MSTPLRPLARLLLPALLLAAPAALHAQVTPPVRPPTPPTAPPTTPPATAPAPVVRDTIPRPAPRDTVRRDSAQVAIPPEAVRGDTLPDAKDTTAVDSTIAAPSFPAFPAVPAFGFSDGAWELGPRELQYFHGLSLAELLDRIPGLVETRSGSFGRPLGISPYATGGGRFRIFLDGYELRPLNSATPDLQRIPLVNVQGVRIQRGLDEVRVDLTSLRLTDIRPFAQIEGMDGDLGTRALRGIFSRPIAHRLMAEVAIEAENTDGNFRREKFNAAHGIARLSYAFAPTAGVQVEYRTTSFDSDSKAGDVSVDFESLDRRETILRGRARLLGGVWVEGMVGRSVQRPAGEDSVTLATKSVQADARATVDLSLGRLTGGVRLHRGDENTWASDQTELWARLDFNPARLVSATGEVRSLTINGVSGLELQGSARLGSPTGISAFAQGAAGSRGIVFMRDTTLELRTLGGLGGLPGVPTLDTVAVRGFRTLDSSLNALRAGAELVHGSIRLGAAFVSHDVDQVAPYGFLHDRGREPVSGERITGVEGYASLPLLVRNLRLDGWYSQWLGSPERPYLPTQVGRAALVFNGVYKQGNLEPFIRFEAEGRNQAIVTNRETGEQALTPRYLIFNSYVQVRIIDIRIFWRFDNVFNLRTASDVNGTLLPGGRALYGVRWFFRN